MTSIILKTAITVVLVVLISEIARRSTLVGAIIASLPITSILAMTWLYVDEHNAEKVAQLSTDIFWLVLPSLVLFVVLPMLLRRDVSFALSLGLACAATIASYAAMLYVMGKVKAGLGT